MALESEIRICNLAAVIRSMCPVAIIINCLPVWMDDVDLTNVDDEVGRHLIEVNKKHYEEVLRREDIVASITFQVVEYHHTAVYILTE